MVPTSLSWEMQFIQDTELVDNLTDRRIEHLQELGGLKKLLVNDERKETLQGGQSTKGRIKKDCDICKKSFLRLNVHKRTHTGERPYSCPQCDKTFITSSQLKTHMPYHTGELRKKNCEICKKTFFQSEQTSINSHRREAFQVQPMY